jgi:U32 family peptidase
MSPAGHWPQLHAAVAAGADAVYFGLQHFSARAKVGFPLAELPEVMASLHERGVKGFVAFNTLVFDRELAVAERALVAIAEAGADAVIVQDVGVAAQVRRFLPELAVHGSTQMSVTSAQGVAFAAAHGARRVVLGRELALADLRRIRSATDVELEVFVHGALCVSYSGQCFSSEAWGGRSANRGQCAQACRLAYDLIVDGAQRRLIDERYLLSPGDLMALAQIPELVEIGIDSFKIEGRYKDADYVALTTSAYRAAIDAAWRGEGGDPAADPALRRDLEQVYSRGLAPTFIAGTDHQTSVRGRAPGHRGVRLGSVLEVGRAGVLVAPPAAAEPPGPARHEARVAAREAAERAGRAPRPGDGVVFDAAHRRSPQAGEEGARIHRVSVEGGAWRLGFGPGDLRLERIRPGDALWRSDDPSLPARVRSRLQGPRRSDALSIAVTATVGAPLVAVATSARGEQGVAVGDDPLTRSSQRPLDLATVRAQFGRLGGTPFHLGDVTLAAEGEPFAPVSQLNALRRALVADLSAQRLRRPALRVVPEGGLLAGLAAPCAAGPTTAPAAGRLHVLVRNAEQLAAALSAHAGGVALESITLDYLELYGLRPAVERVRAAGVRVRVASPRVLKPNEQKIVHFLLALEGEILVRSAGLLRDLAAQPGVRPRLSGDFSLNAANALTVQAFLAAGCDALTPSFDLDAQQIVELAERGDPQRLEVVVHHHLPVFHTEFCVFCRYLSDGHDYTDCGHPCEQHRVALRDSRGRLHPVLADVGCRNTVFGAEAQSAARHWPRWAAAGIRDARVEFVHADAAEVGGVLRAWRAALDGELAPAALEGALRALLPAGISEGSYYVPKGEGLALPALG